MGTVGFVANPHAGKDIRRLVAHASPTSDTAKIGIVRRAVLGAVDAGATRVLLAPDGHRLTERAVQGLDLAAEVVLLDEPVEGRAGDTTAMAARLAKEEADAVVVLGGDGTCRDLAKGWLDPPLVAVSTGTNNVFPRLVEATLAGVAAGLVASGAVPVTDACDRADVVHVGLDDGTDDLALVDVALVEGRFTGARAVWDPSLLRAVVACIAEPASVGLSSVAALVLPVARTEPGGVHVTVGPGRTVRAPLAPGRFADVTVAGARRLAEGDEVVLAGPGVLSFDGERDRVLGPGQVARATIRRDGPAVVDVARTIASAAAAGRFDR